MRSTASARATGRHGELPHDAWPTGVAGQRPGEHRHGDAGSPAAPAPRRAKCPWKPSEATSAGPNRRGRIDVRWCQAREARTGLASYYPQPTRGGDVRGISGVVAAVSLDQEGFRLHVRLSRPSPAMAVGMAAMFVALGGTGYAAGVVATAEERRSTRWPAAEFSSSSSGPFAFARRTILLRRSHRHARANGHFTFTSTSRRTAPARTR